MSNVNTYRVIDFIMQFLPEPVGDSMVLAQRHLNELVAAYDALAPDWDSAPKNAMWYSIDSDGAGRWGRQEPSISGSFWLNVTGRAHTHVIPIGIDWRLCKWQRPEVTR